jgi:hypothetical protein
LKMSEAAVKLEEDAVADAAPDSVPAALEADEPAVAPADPLDAALREYDASVSARPTQPPDQQPPSAPVQPPPSGDEIDAMLAELNTASAAEQQQLEQLRSENSQLRGRIQYETDLKDFNALAGDLQGKLPDFLPDDYAETHLKAAAAENPTLALAFDYRNVDRNAVAVELRKVEIALSQLQRDPYADPQKVASLVQYGQRLTVAYNSAAILRQAERAVIKRAQAVRPPIDPDASADRALVAQSVRSAAGKVAPDPMPNLGQLTDKQFREWGRQNVGFDPV